MSGMLGNAGDAMGLVLFIWFTVFPLAYTVLGSSEI